MNALLDYGSSSSSGTEEENAEEKSSEEAVKLKLPKPSIGESALQTSVFCNPFVEAELAKAAILEKHVKMPIEHAIVKYIGNYCKVPGKDHMQMINGKKICWNYRKGKCRFGHTCKYAHDSDIQKTPQELEAEKEKLRQKTVVCESSGTQTSIPPPQVTVEPTLPTDDSIWEGAPDKKKKRPGLSKSLVPGKKVLQMYKEQKHRDIKNKTK